MDHLEVFAVVQEEMMERWRELGGCLEKLRGDMTGYGDGLKVQHEKDRGISDDFLVSIIACTIEWHFAIPQTLSCLPKYAVDCLVAEYISNIISDLHNVAYTHMVGTQLLLTVSFE